MTTGVTNRRFGYGGAIFAAVMGALGLSFAYAALQSDYGLVRLFQVEAQEARLIEELDRLRAERREIENRVGRLSIDGLDLELLDEQARRVLGLARPDEILIP